MSTVYADARPRGVDIPFRPGNTLTVELPWPAGELTGRTFTSTLGGVALDLAVVGDTMTIEATEAQTLAVTAPAVWLLTETTGGASNDLLIGTWSPSTRPGTPTSLSIPVEITEGVLVEVTVVSGQASLLAHIRADAHTPLDQPLARFRGEAERARTGGFSAVTAWLGDSFTESFEPSKRGLRWINRLAHRLNGLPASVHYVPITTGTNSTTTATDWPGDQPPWTYTGTVNGSVTYGADLHAATLQTGATATLVFFGDTVNLFYVRTPTGPTAAAVTFDGVAQTAINANGSELPGQVVTYGTLGDYGVHTLVVTATAAPLVLEGALVHDGTRFGFGLAFDSVYTLAFGHSGFSTQDFVDNQNWAKSLVAMAGSASLIGISLGPNDILDGRTAAQYRANLVTIMEMIDAAIVAAGGSNQPGYLLVQMPTSGAAYLKAAWEAAGEFDPARAGVLDLAALLENDGAGWGLFDAGNGHPNDAGQLWIADQIATVVNGRAGLALPTMRRGGPVIEASDEPTTRSQWTASFGFTNGQTYDTTSADNAVRERRHREWFEAGTYVARVRYEQITTTGGTVQVLVGNTSAGSVATTGTTGTIGETQLASTITIDSPGWYPVTIRKTNASSAALRFMRLHLRKTG